MFVLIALFYLIYFIENFPLITSIEISFEQLWFSNPLNHREELLGHQQHPLHIERLTQTFPKNPKYGFLTIYSKQNNDSKTKTIVMMKGYLLNSCFVDSETHSFVQYHCSSNQLTQIMYLDENCQQNISSTNFSSKYFQIETICSMNSNIFDDIPSQFLIQTLYHSSLCQDPLFVFAYPTYQCLSLSSSVSLSDKIDQMSIYHTNHTQYVYMNTLHCFEQSNETNERKESEKQRSLFEYNYDSTCEIDWLHIYSQSIEVKDTSSDHRTNKSKNITSHNNMNTKVSMSFPLHVSSFLSSSNPRLSSSSVIKLKSSFLQNNIQSKPLTSNTSVIASLIASSTHATSATTIAIIIIIIFFDFLLVLWLVYLYKRVYLKNQKVILPITVNEDKEIETNQISSEKFISYDDNYIDINDMEL